MFMFRCHDFHEFPALLILSKSCHGKAMASHADFYIHLSMAGCGRAMAAVEVSIYPTTSKSMAMVTFGHGLPWQHHGHCGDFYET